jgi:hypothetical protein
MMLKKLTLFVFLLTPLLTHAQTVIVNFDTPACSGQGIGVYQGIDFSLSPWDCEKNPALPNDSTETLSWYQSSAYSGKFKFLTPAILTSLRAGSMVGGGGMTISTDAGESITIPNVTFGVALVSTGFLKAASVVTVSYSGGWTIELDDFNYIYPSLKIPFPGCCTLTFSITDASQVPKCRPTDGVCSIQIQICDGATPPNCITGTAGSVTLIKTFSLPVQQTVTVPVVQAGP